MTFEDRKKNQMTFEEKSKNILRALVAIADQTKTTESIYNIDGDGSVVSKKVCVYIPLDVVEEIRVNLGSEEDK